MNKIINSYVDYCLKNVRVVYSNGKTFDLSGCTDTKAFDDNNSKTILAQIPGYTAQIVLSRIGEFMFSVYAKFTPTDAHCEKIHKVYTLNFSSSYNESTRMYINHRRQGVTGVNAIADDCICNNFFSFYNINNVKNAFTLMSKLPAKFKSDIEISKTECEFCVKASTTVPYTFDGEIICQEWIICVNMPTDDALTRCADNFSDGREFDNPIGWSTWDYYFTSATEDDVKANVDFIADDELLSKKVRYIALDDGWQQREGDWKSGCRYPSGLKSLAEYINKKGFEAGIWVAPTRLHFLCGTVMRRYDFLVRDEYGDPIKDEDMYVLDPTHPDGERFIRETFSYLADCGFTFYKLDFVSNLVRKSERFFDKNAGHYDALKRLFDIVRETVPKGSHIMGCSLPYGIDTSVSDSRRTGLDIHNVWGHVKACTSSYIPQFAANGKLYRNDLDYLVVRGKDTSDDKMTNVINDKQCYRKLNPASGFVWRGGEDFNYIEAKTWCTVLLMAGSSVFMGDCLPRLNEKGIELLRKTVSEADFCAATPVFDDGRIPSVWFKKELSKLCIINFNDDIREYIINLTETGLPAGNYIDVFTNKEYELTDEFIVSLDGHDSIYLKLKN